MQQRRVRCLVAGRVQGVFFRASAAAKARKLGLRGYAKNLPDGRVEVLLAGQPDEVATMCSWLWKGSPNSRVTGVEIEDWEDEVPEAGFTTG